MLTNLRTLGRVFILLIASLIFTKAFSQAGHVDTTYYKGMGVDGKVNGGTILPDSSVMVIGRYFFLNERVISCIAKLKPDGSNDYSFNPGTGASDNVNAIVVQADGKMIIGGDFLLYNGVTVNRIARINADGSLDNTFVTGTGFENSIYDMHLQPDGKVVIVGNFVTYNGITVNRVVRLNTNGSIDFTFAIGYAANSTVYSVDAQPDQKLIIAGNFSLFDSVKATKIIRLEVTGKRDTSFHNLRITPNNYILDAIVLPSGKIMACGAFTMFDSLAATRIVRINANGSKDSTFTNGFTGTGPVELAAQTDGKVIAVGNFTRYGTLTKSNLMRIDTLGAPDATFAVGTGLNFASNTAFLLKDGRVYVGGTFTSVDSFARFRFARLMPNGRVDHSFFYDSKLNAASNTMAKQSTGKLIVGGSFTTCNDSKTNRIVRFDKDGMLDYTFNSGTGFNNIVYFVTVLPDDKILVGGSFTLYNGKAVNRIVRLHPDGLLDTTFTSGASGDVYKIILGTDNKLYVGGAFTTYSGVARGRIARLTFDGVLDTTFTTGAGFNNSVFDMGFEIDGSIIACGPFTTCAGLARGRIARLKPNGALDTTFQSAVGFGNNICYTICILPDGKILAGGTFTTYNGVSKLRMAKLNFDGTLDVSFTGFANNNQVNVIVPFRGGFMVAGTFTQFNGIARNRMAYVNQTGLIDTSIYYIGSGPHTFLTGTTNISAAFLDRTDNKLYVSGNFWGMHGKFSNRLVRLEGSNINLLTTPTPLCPVASAFIRFVKGAAFNSSNTFLVQLSDSAGNFATPVNIGAGFINSKGSDSVDILIPNNLPAGNNYRIRIVASEPADTSNLSGPIYIGAPVKPVITTAGNASICGNNPVILTTTSPAGYYSWSTGANSSTISVNTPGKYAVTTNTYQCIATSDSFTLTSGIIPDSTISATATSFCPGASVVLSGKPGLKYSWSTGDTTQSVTVNQNGTYTLTVTNTDKCSASDNETIDTTALNNYYIIANGPVQFCQGGSVVLSAVPATTYAWSTGAATQSITVTQPGTYAVTLSNNNCTATSTNTVVVINTAPTAAITGSGPTSFCIGDSVTLIAPVGYQYTWSSGETSRSITVKVSGFYTVTVTDGATGCSASSSPTSTTSTPPPSVGYQFPGGDTICSGQGVIQLTGGTPPGGTYAGTGVTGNTFNPLTHGNKNIGITYTYSANGCSASKADTFFVDICTDVIEIGGNALSIYPNPATTTLFISSTGAIIKDLEITDMLGKVVIKVESAQAATTANVDVAHLQAGSYFVRMGNTKYKFIKAE